MVYVATGASVVGGFVHHGNVVLGEFLHLERKLSPAVILLATASVLGMVLVLEGQLYSVPEAPKNWLPYLFLAYLATGIVWHGWQGRGRIAGFDVVSKPVVDAEME